MQLAQGSPGKNFVAVVGMGGKSLRDYNNKGSNHDNDTWWASIMTGTRYCKNTCTKPDFSGQDISRDNADLNENGVLFITFNTGGDPYAARGVAKSISGHIFDEFLIQAEGSGSPLPTDPPLGETGGATSTPVLPGESQSRSATVTPTPLLNVTLTPMGTPRPTPTRIPVPTTGFDAPIQQGQGSFSAGFSWLFGFLSNVYSVLPVNQHPTEVPLNSVCDVEPKQIFSPNTSTLQIGSFSCREVTAFLQSSPTPLPAPGTPIPTFAQRPSCNALDVVFVIDRSDVMVAREASGTNATGQAVTKNYLDWAKDGLLAFVDHVAASPINTASPAKIGLVTFGGNSTEQYQATLDVPLSSDYAFVRQSIVDRLQYQGQSSRCIECGIAQANDHMQQNLVLGRTQLIVLLSDGFATSSVTGDFADSIDIQNAIGRAAQGKTKAVQYYVRGYGTGTEVDIASLEQIATAKNMPFFSHVPDAFVWPDMFVDIYRQTCN
jgi:hypothetical protein